EYEPRGKRQSNDCGLLVRDIHEIIGSSGRTVDKDATRATTGEEEGDEVLLLPYCPDCHSKISVMFNLYSQLEQLQNQYACVRNEIAFIVVETIGKNCKNGPMDFIRQQICDKWQEFYMEESSKEDFREYFGLDALAATSQIELQDIYDSIVQDSHENIKEEHEYLMDEDDADCSENLDSQNCNSNNTGALNALRGKKSKRRAPSRAFEVQELAQSGENQLRNFTSHDMETKMAIKSGLKMPRLIPMNPNSKVQKALAAVATKTKDKFRGRSGRGNKSYQIDGIPTEQFYGNHTGEDYESTDMSLLSVTSGNETGDVKPSVKSLKKKALSHLNSKLYNPPKQSSGKSTEFPQLQPMLRYPTRNSGRTRSSQAMIETNPAVEMSSFSSSKAAVGDLVIPPAAENETGAGSTPGIFTCTLCPKFYTTTSRLLRHESLCHPSLKSFHCEFCKKGFSSRLTYKRHMGNVHGESTDNDRILQCPICAKSFLKEYSLSVHMESHTEHTASVERPKKKPRGRPVALKRARELELAKESAKNGEVPNGSAPATPVKKNPLWTPEKPRSELSDAGDGDDLTCRICHKVFPYRTLLNMHFITHAKKNYKCDICNSTFTSYTELKFHSDEVHRNKLLPCSVCSKEFSGAESLQRHFKIHDLKQELIEPVEPEQSDGMLLDPPTVDEPILPN
ncbi:unnamed protein product, partial [Allacma fusca]